MTIGNPFLDADLARIKARFEAVTITAKPMPCMFPPKPWHIVARENARKAFKDAKRYPQSWGLQNAAENWTREAIRMHRMLRGNSVVQTFGGVL